jgi:DNA-binding NtrC family response regulator
LAERNEELLLAALRERVHDFRLRSEPIPAVAEAIAALIPPLKVVVDRASPESWGRLVGESLSVRQLKTCLPRLAAADCNLLITGETGTGKDLTAELIHRNSRRSRGPFVCVNCAAFPDSLFESELFGHERGAFTGASATRQGKLEAAHCGTIFLDEIGEMTPQGQAKMLRALETRQIQRLGSNTGISVNIRVIAATNQNLAAMVNDKKFRGDLFFRLNVARLHLPPLRDRKQDIPLLLENCVQEASRRAGIKPPCFSSEALAILLQHDWPGNVRELKNVVEAIFIYTPEREIGVSDLPEWFISPEIAAQQPAGKDDRERLLEVLRSTSWNKSKAAEKLNWSRMTLYRKLARYGLDGAHALVLAEST